MLCDFFDDQSEPIVKLENFYGPRKNLVKKCLILFSDVLCKHLQNAFDCKQIARFGSSNGSSPVWSFHHQGEQLAFYLSPIGSALAGGTVAEVSHLTGANQFIMFGSCGSLNSEQTQGKFILPTEAYRGEGLSWYFAPAKDYITIRNADLLASIFTELKIPFVKGRNWTTDCMLRETVNLVKKRKEEGCVSVEMELAGVQAVCDFYGYQLYDFLAAGDVLSEEDYDVADLADANHNIDKLQIALQIAQRI